MKRSIKHEVSNQRGQPASQGAGHELPYWSNYLLRLGSQVKKAANTTIWTGAPIVASEPVGVGAAPHHRARHPGGDRRMSVEQRRELVGGGVHLRELPEAHVIDTPKTRPSLSGYLSGLGQQQTTRSGDGSGGAGGVESRPGARYGIRRPIGDRRTGPGQRRERTDSRQGTGKGLLHRLWGRLTAKTRRTTDKIGAVSLARFSLGIWGYYFIAKLGLYWMGLIAFHTMENLVFVAFILLPVSSRLLYRIKNILAAVLALGLLYHDSWLPSVRRLMSQASLLSDFSLAYLFELSGRFFSWQIVGLLLACGLVYWMVARLIRVGVLVVAAMLILAVIQSLPDDSKVAAQGRPDMDKFVQYFFDKEAERSILFVTPQADATPFDVIFIHVCSLSWDDVRAVGLEEHPLWQRFDILLTRFNSAASYSGPAALHLLRAKCGQPQHGGMYTPAADKCYLMNSLQRSGFEPNLVLNHDGKFDDFLGQLKKHGGLTAPPMPLDGVDIAQYAFDKSPVYDDLAVLDRWLETRQASASTRVALYYNTVSMHDGNHFSGTHSAANTLETYKIRLAKFLDETESFMQKLEKSGRRAVVVMVPEHGAAVRGDKMQIAGMREIPTPSISLVPVGIKLIGGNRAGEGVSIDQPTSYLAISHIVERMLEQSPFDNTSFDPSDYVANLPNTIFVSQNETTTVADSLGQYYLSRGDTKWADYAEFNKADAQP